SGSRSVADGAADGVAADSQARGGARCAFAAPFADRLRADRGRLNFYALCPKPRPHQRARGYGGAQRPRAGRRQLQCRNLCSAALPAEIPAPARSGLVRSRIDRNPVIAQKLYDSELDVAIMEWWEQRPGFSWKRWRSEPLVLIVPPDHPLCESRQISKRKLAE